MGVLRGEKLGFAPYFVCKKMLKVADFCGFAGDFLWFLPCFVVDFVYKI